MVYAYKNRLKKNNFILDNIMKNRCRLSISELSDTNQIAKIRGFTIRKKNRTHKTTPTRTNLYQ